MKRHVVSVNDRNILIIGDPSIVRDNVNVDTLKAYFDDYWNEVDSISVFFVNGETVIRQQYSDEMKIPWEVLVSTGTLLLTFKGYRGNEEIIVTKEMKSGFVVEKSGFCNGGEEPSEASPTEVQQIYNDIHGIREDIEAGMVKGDPGDPGEPGYTPQKGVDYFDGEDGYTPVKDIDYFDGEPGYTPQKGIDYFDGEPGYTPVKGVDYFDGEPGQPGQDGSDYVITEDDYQAIADVVLDEIDIPESEIFWCEYGVTTYQEIADAIDAGKLPIAVFGGKNYTYRELNADGRFYFVNNLVNHNYYVSVGNNNVWRSGDYALEQLTNKTTSVTSASTDTQYPSAGATYRAIRAVDKELERAERRIEILEAAATGKTHIWELVNEDSSSTDVPAELTEKDGKGYADLVGIEGKTVVWNQEFECLYNQNTNNGIVSTKNPDDSFNMSGTATGLQYGYFNLMPTKTPMKRDGRKYLMGTNKKVGNEMRTVGFNNKTTDTWLIWSNSSGGTWPNTLGITASEGETFNVQNVRIYIIDLTAMFGAGNEPTDISDPRIEWVKQYAAEHPEYNPGKLMSMEVAEVESVGKNLLDDSNVMRETTVGPSGNIQNGTGFKTYWSKIDAGTYMFSSDTSTRTVVFGFFDEPPVAGSIAYDGQRHLIDLNSVLHSLSVTVPKNCYVAARVANDATYVQLERGTTATAYSPYGTKDTVEVPNVSLKSAGTANDRLDFMAGEVVKRVGVVDLGTLNWTIENISANNPVFKSANNPIAAVYPANNKAGNIVCAKYETKPLYTTNTQGADMAGTDKTIAMRSNATRNIEVHDTAYTDAASFKAAMQGVLLYYELAEPTTEAVELPDSWLTAEANGAIRYVDADGKPVSVPHAIQFPINVNGGA